MTPCDVAGPGSVVTSRLPVSRSVVVAAVAPAVAGGWTLVPVSADAGGVGHDVGDVVLLVDAAEEVRHGPLGVDGHVLSAVRGAVPGHCRLLQVGGAVCSSQRPQRACRQSQRSRRAPLGSRTPSERYSMGRLRLTVRERGVANRQKEADRQKERG